MYSGIFMNKPTGIIFACLDEGKNRKIVCEDNSDCGWEKMGSFCNPSSVISVSRNNLESIAILNCISVIKCSPDKSCEYYCR